MPTERPARSPLLDVETIRRVAGFGDLLRDRLPTCEIRYAFRRPAPGA